jgi:iron complex outermembrane receptor protein
VKRRLFTPYLLGPACVAAHATGASAQNAPAQNAPATVQQASQDLSVLSIEELAQLPVRSASKREEPLSAAPTALFVITGEDIIGSGATSLPEALRLAPNLQVQQVNGFEYAITARGFNSVETANKLLVLIDGRSIYSTLHSGVFWQLHSPLLEDIQQIEVISGPGGTLYGPNAVNGVISIASRDARETLGGLVRGTAGAFERTLGGRYGVTLGSTGAIRFYGNYFDRDALARGPIGPVIDDAFSGWQAGMRADLESGASHFTLQGDLFDNDVDSLPGDGHRGHNILARWSHNLSDTSSFRLQGYYDYFERQFLLAFDSLQTFDLDAQFNASFGAHDLVMGAGMRTTRDRFTNALNNFALVPASQRLWIYNGFVQDRIRLTPALSLTVGIKAEETSFTGVELLPNLRLAWQPDERTLLWAAVSRAVRTPSRIDRELEAQPLLLPAPDFVSEKLIAFEAGYRGQPTARTTLSVSVFYNLYDDIRTADLVTFIPSLQVRLANGLEGHSYGVEAWSTTQLASWWRLNLGASAIFKHFRAKPGHIDLSGRDSLGHDPDFQLFARTQMNLTDRLQLNAGLRYVGEIDSAPPIGAYVEADASLSFRLTDLVEIYVAGRNLLHDRHLESNDPERAHLVQRSLAIGTRLRF